MSDNAYDQGRLDLPFVGHCTFAKSRPITNWDEINADVAVLGAPNDMGTQWRPGARFGPRGIREASTLFSFGHSGAYDHEDDTMYLTEDQLRMVDVGDADIVHTDQAKSNANIEKAVRKILEKGAMPVVLGFADQLAIGVAAGRVESVACILIPEKVVQYHGHFSGFKQCIQMCLVQVSVQMFEKQHFHIVFGKLTHLSDQDLLA